MDLKQQVRVQDTERGVSLVELLVVLAIISAIALVSLPAFLNWLRAYKVRTVSQQLQGELRLARNAAVARNQNVDVLIKLGEFSWTDAQGRQRRFVLPEGVTVTNLVDPSGGDTVTLGNNGRVVDPSKTLEIEGYVGDGVTHEWIVSFTASGKVALERTAP